MTAQHFNALLAGTGFSIHHRPRTYAGRVSSRPWLLKGHGWPRAFVSPLGAYRAARAKLGEK